jgi:hypothetical protein
MIQKFLLGTVAAVGLLAGAGGTANANYILSLSSNGGVVGAYTYTYDVSVDNGQRIEPGVIGTRMTGGGFGGCTVTLVEAARAEAMMAAVSQGYRLRTGRDATLFTTRPAAGARMVPRGTGATPAVIF